MSKRTTKKPRTDEGGEEEVPASEQSQRALFLKPVFSKRPWYLGGKVVFSEDGQELYSAFQGSLAAVDVATQQIKFLLAEGDDVVQFASTFNHVLATVSRKGLIRVFENQVNVRQFASLHTQQVSEMCMHGDLLATGGMDAVVKLFSVSGGYVTHNLRGHTSHITALAFSQGVGIPKLASGDFTGSICVWDLTKKTPNQWFKGTHLSVVPSLAFTQDYLVSVGRDRIFSVWDYQAGKLVKTIPTVNESLEAVIGLGGNDFAIAGSLGALRRFGVDTTTGKVKETSNVDLGHGDGVAFLVKRGMGEICAVSQVELVFSYHQIDALEQESRGKQCGFDDEMLDCAFVDAQRAMLAVCTNSPLLRLYEFNGDLCVNVSLLRGHTASVLAVACNAAGLLVTGSKDNSLRVWQRDSTGSFQCQSVLTGHADSVSTLALGVHAPVIVSGSDDGSIRLWDQNTYVLLDSQVAAHTKAVLDVSFAPNNQELLGSCSADKTARIWQLVRSTGNQLRLVRKCDLIGHRRQVNSIRLSSVDRVCVTASSDLTVRVWSVDSGACVRTLEGHTAAVSRALIMKNGHSVLSTGADGTVKTWDLKSSACGQTLFGKKDGGHEERIWSATVCQESEGGEEYVCTVGVEGVLTVWKDAHVEETARKNSLVKEERDNKDELDRSMREKRYVDAARLALRLERPNQLKQILQLDATVLPVVLKQCSKEELGMLLTCVLQWNTVGRNCLVAQRCLIELLDMDRVELETKVGTAALARFLKAMLPYTERHFNRIDRLIKTSYLIDRVLETTRSIA
ncbi:hypothetical protein BASA81_008438 [Batrachochytrium salamandrivorans]|nr:hypothetical protein BASA81_008438 [Batrachochytrium salamandrivorans]